MNITEHAKRANFAIMKTLMVHVLAINALELSHSWDREKYSA